MGIDPHGLRLIEYTRRKAELGEVLAIGRQWLNVDERNVRRFLSLPPSVELPAGPYVDPLLIEHFGAKSVSSLDASDYEGATFVRDLNDPLEDDFPQFDTVIDGGSLEHVFNTGNAFRNVVKACRVGGQILHISPANNFVGHGFYQFAPELFFSLYSRARGFEETEVFLADLGRPNAWWKVTAPAPGKRAHAMSTRESYVLVRTRKVEATSFPLPIQQSTYSVAWDEQVEQEAGPERTSARVRLKRTVGMLPETVQTSMAQIERRTRTGLHRGNPILERVVPPHSR